MANWKGLADQLEGAVDGQFGTNATWTPMLGAKGYSAPVPDPFEPQDTIVGFIIGRRGLLRPPASEFLSRRLDADVLFSIQNKYLGTMKKGDRLDIEERPDEQFEISFIEPPTYSRTVIHLIRVKA